MMWGECFQWLSISAGRVVLCSFVATVAADAWSQQEEVHIHVGGSTRCARVGQRKAARRSCALWTPRNGCCLSLWDVLSLIIVVSNYWLLDSPDVLATNEMFLSRNFHQYTVYRRNVHGAGKSLFNTSGSSGARFVQKVSCRKGPYIHLFLAQHISSSTWEPKVMHLLPETLRESISNARFVSLLGASDDENQGPSRGPGYQKTSKACITFRKS